MSPGVGGVPAARAEDWRILAILGPYRLVLIAVLAALFHFDYAPEYFAAMPGPHFVGGAAVYAVLTLGLYVFAYRRRSSLTMMALLHFTADLVAVCLLVSRTGGVSGGLGILLLPPLIGCSLVLPLRLALVLAATASLSMLGEEGLRQIKALSFNSSDFSQVGLLGLMLFATGLGAAMVGQRARRSEAAAERVGTEFFNLTQLNENIIAEMHAGVLVVDADGLIRTANTAAQRLTAGGAWPQQPLALTLPALHQQLLRWQQGDNRSIAAIPGSAGRELLPRFTRLGLDERSPTLIMLEDAAELRAQAQQLKLAALGRLSANIAHEIRNPLSAITQAGQLLGEAGLAPGDQRLVDMIQRHAVRIEQIVRSVLEISRRAPAARAILGLRDVILRSTSLYHEAHPQEPRPIELGDVPLTLSIAFDPDQLQQVLFNLWDNSFEHGGEGIMILLEAGIDAESGLPYLDIRDNGPGIPSALVERIFEPFFTTHHAGTGLGLYLCRELCEYNQALLRYIAPAHGACFRIVFSSPAGLR